VSLRIPRRVSRLSAIQNLSKILVLRVSKYRKDGGPIALRDNEIRPFRRSERALRSRRKKENESMNPKRNRNDQKLLKYLIKNY